MPVSEETYRRLVLEDPEGKWELRCGRLRSKPPMTWEHNESARELRRLLEQRLPHAEYIVVIDQGRVQRASSSYFIPDLYVVPRAMARRLFQAERTLEAYPEPLPLVVEVWSPSTGEYDVDEKLAEYQARGDLEIWRLHPYERTVTAWQRQPDGSYNQQTHASGRICLAALPQVCIVVEEIFATL